MLVLVLLTAWLSHPLIENLQSLLAKARKEERWKTDKLGHTPHVLNLVLRCPRSVRLKLAQLVAVYVASTSGTSCLRMSQQRENDCLFT